MKRDQRAWLMAVAGLASGIFLPGAAASQERPAPELLAVAASEHENMRRAPDMIARAEAYLKSQQDASTGGWKTEGQGPKFPAITGLVVSGMLMDPQMMGKDLANDEPLSRAVKYLLSKQQPDGGIHDGATPTYNTSICISALSKVNTPEAKEAVKKAAEYLKGLQYGEGAAVKAGADDSAQQVGKDHAFYGGVGYGRSGRPDLSNLAFALEALHDAGIEPSDPVFQRALVFLQRTQMIEKTPEGAVINDMPYAKGSTQGGFIYSTSENKDKVGVGQSMAGVIEESLDDGTKVSRLRAYGSMTYSGFKSYLYADLPRDDARVQAAMKWIRDHYTVQENPGMGTEGVYYYYVVMSRALAAWGEKELMVRIGEPSPTGEPSKAGDVMKPVNWAKDLIARLAELQQPDGSFKVIDDRWMETDPVLITAYAVIALRNAERFE